MLWFGFIDTFQLLQIDCRWHGLIEEFKNETSFLLFTPELCLFFLWIFSRNTSDFTIYSGKAPFYWLAPLHCPPQGPFPPFIHGKGLTLASALLKCDCVPGWLEQSIWWGCAFSKPFEEGVSLGNHGCPQALEADQWILRPPVYLRTQP